MLRITTKLILFILSAFTAGAATVTFDLTNFLEGVSLPTNTTALIYLTKPTTGGSGVSIGNPTRLPVGAVTNLASARYKLLVNNETWATPLIFDVPAGSGSYNLSQLATNTDVAIGNAPFVSQLIAGDGISLSPTNGKSVVTITATGGSSTGGILLDGTGEELLLDQ